MITNNPITNFNKSLFSSDGKLTLQYIKDFINNGTTNPIRIRLIIVGQEEVGKTTLVKALQGKKMVNII